MDRVSFDFHAPLSSAIPQKRVPPGKVDFKIRESLQNNQNCDDRSEDSKKYMHVQIPFCARLVTA